MVQPHKKMMFCVWLAVEQDVPEAIERGGFDRRRATEWSPVGEGVNVIIQIIAI